MAHQSPRAGRDAYRPRRFQRDSDDDPARVILRLRYNFPTSPQRPGQTRFRVCVRSSETVI